MKIAFFGTPEFTVNFLETLKSSGFCPSLVVTNPDRPSGRGMVMTSPLPKKWADENSIKVLQPEKLGDEVFEELSKDSWDLFVVIAYGKIIPERFINLPKFGTINLHYSLLPKYRGATPVESAILAGDEISGITIQKMRFKLDTGPIIFQEEMNVDALEARLYFKGVYSEGRFDLKTQVDVTRGENFTLPTQNLPIIHLYSDSDVFKGLSFKCQKLEEIIATKFITLIHRRKPGDFWDLVFSTFISNNHEVNRG